MANKKHTYDEPPPGAEGGGVSLKDFGNAKATWQVKVEGLLPSPDDPAYPNVSAVAHASILGKDLRREMHKHLQELVEQRLKDMDASDYLELHMEEEITSRVRDALEKGWKAEGGGMDTVEKAVSRKIQDLATRRIADEYEVVVDVSLRKVTS